MNFNGLQQKLDNIMNLVHKNNFQIVALLETNIEEKMPLEAHLATEKSRKIDPKKEAKVQG